MRQSFPSPEAPAMDAPVSPPEPLPSFPVMVLMLGLLCLLARHLTQTLRPREVSVP